MTSNIITRKLSLFPKPDLSNKLDLECGICYEKLVNSDCVGLPCSCANSIYHLECISDFLSYQYSRNFCPYCRKKYELLTNAEIEKDEENEYNRDIRYSSNWIRNNNIKICLLFIHCILNSILNITCLTLLNPNNPTSNLIIIPSLGFLFNFIQCGFFAKIFFNILVFSFSAKQTDRAYRDGILGSNLSQLLLVLLTINCRNHNFLEYHNYKMIIFGHIVFFIFDTLLKFCVEKFIM